MDLNRRDFTRLSLAAFSGAVAGASLAGCGGGDLPKPNAGAVTDIHACRGMNTCKGNGKGGANDCAGYGECATTAAHDCATKNDCKNLGGCGEAPGANDCKGTGGCEVPLHAGAWEKAREAFEKRMATAGKKVGKAPDRKEK